MMTDTTWSVRIPAELKEKISQLLEKTGMTSKDLIADMVHIYALNKAREVLPTAESDIRELQELTRRISAIFVNLVERIKIEGELTQKEWQSRLAEKEAELEKQKARLQELQRTVQGLEEDKKVLAEAKQEIEEELAAAVEMNTTLKSLVNEYKEKNSGLQAEVKKLTIYAEENESLRRELARITEENKYLAAKIKETTEQLERAKQEKETELEKARLEKDHAVLAVRNEYEKKVNALLEQKFAKYLKSQLQGEKGV